MTVITRRRHGKTRTAFLGCLSHHKRGPHICPNGRLVPLETANNAVLGALNAEALDPRIVSAVIEMVFAQLAPAHAESSRDALRRDLRDVDEKIAHLTAAVERGAALDPLIAQLHARQQERERLLTAIASARTLGRLHVDRAAIEATVQAQCARWRALLTESLEDGRTLLREVLSGPLVFTPEGKGYHFRARVATGELIASAVNDGAGAGAHKVASPSIPSWNQIAGFLESMRRLKDSAGFAA